MIKGLVIRAALALGGLALLPPPVAAQDGGVRYCYALDPASNTLFASQGFEDVRTAAGFAAFLKARGSVSGETRATCAGAAGEPQVNRAKETLARSCGGCNSSTRMVSVTWPAAPRPAPADEARPPVSPAASAAVARGGGIAAQPMGGAPASTPPATVVNAGAAPVTSSPKTGPLLVVLGNERDGRMLVFRDIPDIVATATREARRYRPDGWSVLLASSQTGTGAAMCVTGRDARTGEKRTFFFPAFPHQTPRDAIKAAQEKVRPKAAELREISYICGPPWVVHGEAEPPAREESIIGTVKGYIRRQVTCEAPPEPPKSKVVPIYGPNGPVRQPAPPAGAASCGAKEKFIRGNSTCMCVRG